MNCLELLNLRKVLEEALLYAQGREKQKLRVAVQAAARECRERGCRLEVR